VTDAARMLGAELAGEAGADVFGQHRRFALVAQPVGDAFEMVARSRIDTRSGEQDLAARARCRKW